MGVSESRFGEMFEQAGQKAGTGKNAPMFRQLSWALGLTVILASGPWLPASHFFASPSAYLPLHTVLEFVAMAVSAMIFTLAWNLRKSENNSHIVLLGVAALGVALIDLVHTLSFKGMPDFVTPSDPEKAINFWLAGRFIAALSLLGVAFIPVRRWSATTCYLALGGGLALVCLVWWIGLMHPNWLPRTFTTEHGLTPVKIVAEYILAGMYGAAALGLLRYARQRQETEIGWLATAAWVMALAEMSVTLYQDVTDLFNLLGHLYKAAAYIMVYRALFVAGVAAPYKELRKSEAFLAASRQKLRELSAHNELMLEEERRSIAREIHDELGQLLTALRMDCSILLQKYPADPYLQEKISDMRTLLANTIGVARHVVSHLRPTALDHGIIPAIEWLAEDFSLRWETPCNLHLDAEDIVLDDARATALFRIVQESLTNIARHAQATEVSISLQRDGTQLEMRVQDDGCGFDHAEVAKQRGFGLRGMRERAIAFNGSMRIHGKPGIGTTLVVAIPL